MKDEKILKDETVANDDFEKLDEEQLDDVAGGSFFGGDSDNECEDGHDLDCTKWWYMNVANKTCPNSSSGKHKFDKVSEETKIVINMPVTIRHYACVYCGETADN